MEKDRNLERQTRNFLLRHKNCTKKNHVCNTHTYLSGPPIPRKRGVKRSGIGKAWASNRQLDKELKYLIDRDA